MRFEKPAARRAATVSVAIARSLTFMQPPGILPGMNQAGRIDRNLWWLPSKERAIH